MFAKYAEWLITQLYIVAYRRNRTTPANRPIKKDRTFYPAFAIIYVAQAGNKNDAMAAAHGFFRFSVIKSLPSA